MTDPIIVVTDAATQNVLDAVSDGLDDFSEPSRASSTATLWPSPPEIRQPTRCSAG